MAMRNSISTQPALCASIRDHLIAHGALVLLAGLLAGFPFAFLELGRIVLWPVPGEVAVAMPGDVRAWRMAHLEGILNGLLLFAIAAILHHLALSGRELRWLFVCLVVTAWGNVLASLIGPIFGGRGLAFGDGWANSVMYLLFVAAVFAVFTALVLVYRGATRSLRSNRRDRET